MMTFAVVVMVVIVIMVVVFASMISRTEINSRVLADQLSRDDVVADAAFSTFLIEQKWILPCIKRKASIFRNVVRKILGLKNGENHLHWFNYIFSGGLTLQTLVNAIHYSTMIT